MRPGRPTPRPWWRRPRPWPGGWPGCAEAVGRIIFGQESVVEQTLITLLSGGHALLVGVPGLGKTRLVETLGTVLGLDAKRVQFTPDLMPADILGSEVLEEREDGRRAFRFLRGPGLLPAPDGRRDQPRLAPHPVGAAAGDAGAPGGGGRRDPRPARALPRARHPEPDRAGGHLPAARGAARPLPAGGGGVLPGRGGRARHAARHHRRAEPAAGPGDDGAGADRRPGPDPAHPGGRGRAGRHPAAGARRPAGGEPDRVGAPQPRPGGRGRARRRR